MREKVVEQKLIQAVRRSGGLALKLVCPGFNGVPDRMEQLRDMGFKVFAIDDEEQIGGIMDEICSS